MDSIPPASLVPRSRRSIDEPTQRIAELERALRRATAEATTAKEEAHELRRKVVRLEADVQRMRATRDALLRSKDDRPSGVRSRGIAEDETTMSTPRAPVPRVR